MNHKYPTDAPKILRPVDSQWKVIFHPSKTVEINGFKGFYNRINANTREEARALQIALKLEGRTANVYKYFD